jgi:hypothetical protein
MPERYAQAALGHGSRAVHRAYAKQAVVLTPCLEELTSAMHRTRPEPCIADGFTSSLGA